MPAPNALPATKFAEVPYRIGLRGTLTDFNLRDGFLNYYYF